MKNKFFTKQKKLFVVIAITIVFLFVISPFIFNIKGGVLALDTGLEKTATTAGLPSNTSLAGIIGQIIYAILGFLGVVFVILLIYGGFIRMTAQGAPDKIKTSTGIITSAIVGIIIILASYAITAFVMGSVKKSVGSGSGGGDGGETPSCESESGNFCMPSACGPDATRTAGFCENNEVCCCCRPITP